MEEWIIVAIAFVAGLVIGIGANVLTGILIKRRSDKAYSVWYINYRYSPILWAVCFAVILAVQAFLKNDILWLIRLSVILFACACIAATDACIRKVPNSMLAFMLLNTLVFTLFFSQSFDWIQTIVAVAGAIIVFQIPSLLGLKVGWGDDKFAVVVAVELSVFGFLQTMVIVGIGFLVAAIYLKATHKGNLKTPIPMGPFIALGTVFTAVCPLI